MELKQLVTLTLADALRGMEVGESCLAPEGYERGTVVDADVDSARSGGRCFVSEIENDFNARRVLFFHCFYVFMVLRFVP